MDWIIANRWTFLMVVQTRKRAYTEKIKNTVRRTLKVKICNGIFHTYQPIKLLESYMKILTKITQQTKGFDKRMGSGLIIYY